MPELNVATNNELRTEFARRLYANLPANARRQMLDKAIAGLMHDAALQLVSVVKGQLAEASAPGNLREFMEASIVTALTAAIADTESANTLGDEIAQAMIDELTA